MKPEPITAAELMVKVGGLFGYGGRGMFERAYASDRHKQRPVGRSASNFDGFWPRRGRQGGP